MYPRQTLKHPIYSSVLTIFNLIKVDLHEENSEHATIML